MDLYDYDRWDNFSKEELTCRHTGLENPNVGLFTHLMDDVQEIRSYIGVPFKVTSAYRDPSHPDEVCKERPGMHTKAAIDIQVPVEYCYLVLEKALELGFTGIGINLTGDHSQRFIHLDKRTTKPRIWSY